MNLKKSSIYKEIFNVYFFYSVLYAGLYYYSSERLAHDGILHDISHFMLSFSPVVVVYFTYNMYQSYKKETTNWVVYWRERGYTVPQNNESYEDDFEGFFREYYSSEKICNRVSDAWETASNIIFISIVIIIFALSYLLDISLNPRSDISELVFIEAAAYVTFLFVAPVLSKGGCKLITNRYPGEARRSRTIPPYNWLNQSS